MTDITTVAVLGTGVLGSQIAFQTAYSGFAVTAYDISDDALAAARERFAHLAATYRAEVPGAAEDGKADLALMRLTLSTDLDAAAQADLVIEAVPEVLDLKRDVYTRLGELAPAKTIFATNSSTLLPSDMVEFTGRPDRFLALHFANRVWKFNTAEVMGTTQTDPAVFATVEEFATEIGMVPIAIHKEKAGYVLNTLLVPLLNAGMGLAAGGYASVEDIDKTWRIATGAPLGPLQILDVIGLTTPYNILTHSSTGDEKLATWLKETYIDQGKLGVATGEGFYKYA
ncbi:MAG: 3-hydroxyacyl-CoA dehydrogenase [Microbacterium sp.]|jgi:3-hydroxyacyl-CoA dehydrogenase|uniref:3-hydroxyacyl-CoA dehydrogenase n=1 Tax=Microbacterium TaxID=33882 RepID=UPI000EE9F090|nr:MULTISPECIES: 3-hydroxyacyl-CoA dehydrogenase [Microbacterium]MEC8762976.1 3-hydroxyacyl-CoA dehydrogenase [Actinomycetota bacterium]HAM13382.1 3-hydroxyacyl-CoA dehydrogenase [Microbacterium sp.]MCC4268291.1 3-hydroxyacyl-CoA dehydrogenase [Microbacterium schleiferi]HCM49527.1 3-hydroxyacyl-CoA dehydrogenase [Microbacterium sp.]HCU79176.1 3-hydroxyacyl-CoA dehydrogenase [Microbacterium sp.]|tara:strand:- start:21794 stop:22648 length:855 start_codon:yes stop_codon:yes gene_type:complete